MTLPLSAVRIGRDFSHRLNRGRLPVRSVSARLTFAICVSNGKLYGLCVVDDRGDLIGVLTIKDLIDALFHLSAVALRRDSESLSDRLQS